MRGGGVETYLNLETGPALELSNFDIDIHNNIIMKKKPPYCLNNVINRCLATVSFEYLC